MRTRTSTFGLLVATAMIISGCLPASRVSHSENRQNNDAQALHSAQTTQGLAAERRKVLMAAERWLGSPYRYGGSSKSGTDCSGFVRSVFQEAGVLLPRTSREQANTGSAVATNLVQPGDLLFFNTTGGGVSHVGISLGEEEFVHASTSHGVIVSSLQESYYKNRFLFARRVL